MDEGCHTRDLLNARVYILCLGCFLMSAMTARAPSRANCILIPRPIPELAPVTMATRSLSLIGRSRARRPGVQRCGHRQSTWGPSECQSRALAALISFLITLLVGLGSAPAFAEAIDVQTDLAATPAEAIWRADVEASRSRKDSLFRQDEESPLRSKDIPSFSGLRYFPSDFTWRVEGQFHRYGRTRQVPLPDTGGTTIAVERFGRFVFQHDGKPFWLEVFRSLQGGALTVYFTDETNGSQTYGAGRYAAVSQADDSTYMLDFNGAYNPYCAYNEDYICPLPPKQNHLPFEVAAGETNPGPELAH